MANKFWPQLWAENSPELLQLARQFNYLVALTPDGLISCKACGAIVPWEPLDLHYARHMAELDTYLNSKRKDSREDTAEGFYPNPCTECGNQIPRSGKPGRPPVKCDMCAFPNADKILEELGL